MLCLQTCGNIDARICTADLAWLSLWLFGVGQCAGRQGKQMICRDPSIASRAEMIFSHRLIQSAAYTIFSLLFSHTLSLALSFSLSLTHTLKSYLHNTHRLQKYLHHTHILSYRHPHPCTGHHPLPKTRLPHLLSAAWCRLIRRFAHCHKSNKMASLQGMTRLNGTSPLLAALCESEQPA